MNTLVVCRIADPRLKRSLQARLRDRGFAIAPGIFDCDFESDEFAALQSFLEGLDYAPNDHVLLFPLCASCQKKRLAFGSVCRQNNPDVPWIIL